VREARIVADTDDVITVRPNVNGSVNVVVEQKMPNPDRTRLAILDLDEQTVDVVMTALLDARATARELADREQESARRRGQRVTSI
jgi:hypothetical protein